MLGLPRRGAFALVALATIAYALLVGLMPSVVRSAAMTVTVCLAGMLDRSARPANLLALAALVTLLVNPAYLFDTGCQLSFLANQICKSFIFNKLSRRNRQLHFKLHHTLKFKEGHVPAAAQIRY